MNRIERDDLCISDVYIGDADDCDADHLRDYGVRTVVNVSGYHPEREVVMHWRYRSFPMKDGKADQLQFQDAVRVTLDAVRRAYFNEDNPVLVHCAAGKSRSPTVLGAALARHIRSLPNYDSDWDEVTFDDGLDVVREVRSVDPHPALRTLAEAHLNGRQVKWG